MCSILWDEDTQYRMIWMRAPYGRKCSSACRIGRTCLWGIHDDAEPLKFAEYGRRQNHE